MVSTWTAVLEIAADHSDWPFSDHMANQNLFWSAKLTVHFQWEGNTVAYKKVLIFKKWPTNFWSLFIPLEWYTIHMFRLTLNGPFTCMTVVFGEMLVCTQMAFSHIAKGWHISQKIKQEDRFQCSPYMVGFPKVCPNQWLIIASKVRFA